MLTQKQILEEIARCCPDKEFAAILKREHHTKPQEDAISNAWEGLLWWRRTYVEEMVKAYD